MPVPTGSSTGSVDPTSTSWQCRKTKCKDEQFPYERFKEIGYEVAHVGLSQWNGVAIASRVGLDDVQIGFEDQPGFDKDPEADPVREARAIGATCGGVRVWSLYVPNGRELEDPHYAYKLDWLAKLRDDAEGWLKQDPDAQIALVGDWNVAPTDDDVWDPAFFEGKTHTSEPERAAFTAFTESGFADVVRPYTPGPGVYTYWDYTQLRFRRSRVCESTSSSAHRHSQRASRRPRSIETSEKARAPAITLR